MPLPTHSFDERETKIRYGERYVSQGSNLKFTGFPFGAYAGFTPVVTAGSMVLRLETNASYGLSLVRAQSTADQKTSVDIVTEVAVELDFTGHDWLADPTAYVMARANVALGGATTGEVFTRNSGPANLTEQLLCIVTRPVLDLVVAVVEPADRDTPYAYTGAPVGHGFMASGAVEELVAAVAVVVEVEEAREDLTGFVHPYPDGLHDRIVADLQPAAIAGRLGLVYRVVRSNNYTLAIDTSEVNVSSSFTETARLRLPVTTFEKDGSESQAGAVTSDDAEGRNVCFVCTTGTNARPVDGERRVVFGRLEMEEKTLTGNLTFSAVSAVVTGTGTDFTDPTQTQEGDIILNANDGLYYTILSISDGVTLTLDQIPSAGGGPAAATRRRWLLKLFSRSSAGEAASGLTAGTVIGFFCGAWFSIGSSVYDAVLEMFEGGEEPPLPDAAPSIEGKALMYPGLAGAKAGAVQSVQLRGAAVGTGLPFYSLGFDGAFDATGGAANITMAGEKGDQGAPGTGTGPPGAAGAAGDGFDTFSEDLTGVGFIPSPVYGNWQAAPPFYILPPGTIHVYTFDFPSTVKYLHGGLREWSGETGNAWFDQDDHFDITSVFRTDVVLGDNRRGRIEWTRPNISPFNPITNQGMFLNGAG